MTDPAYRAVFLRVHPTGKMVLSLTTEADGNEARYAQLVADELGVPALDVKVVPADENRFGAGHGFNTTPSAGIDGGDRERDREDPREGAAAGRRRPGARRPHVGQRRVRLGRRALEQSPTSRSTPMARAHSPQESRVVSTRRPYTGTDHGS